MQIDKIEIDQSDRLSDTQGGDSDDQDQKSDSKIEPKIESQPEEKIAVKKVEVTPQTPLKSIKLKDEVIDKKSIENEVKLIVDMKGENKKVDESMDQI